MTVCVNYTNRHVDSHQSYFNINFQAQASERQELEDGCENNVPNKAPQIIISKLNPLVQEFVPNNIESTNNDPRNHSLDCNTFEDLSNGKHSPKTLEEVPKTSSNDATCPNSSKQKLSQDSSVETGRKGAGDCRWVNYKEAKDKIVTRDDTKAHDSDVQMYPKGVDKKKIIAMLKKRISNIPKDSPFDKRKDRNVAIAALIKANTDPATASDLKPSLPSTKATLRTPDYFKGPSTSENIVAQLQENPVSSPSTSSQKLLKEDKSKEIENVEDKVLEENVTPQNEVTLKTPVDSYMRESINKVKNWLNSPPRSKPTEPHQGTTSNISKLKPAEPYFGAITFKKKSVQDRNSPKSDISISKSSVMTTPSYLPSKHAQDLVKKYEERNQVKVKEEYVDIWTKLERDLKIKDEEFRLRMREKEAQKKDNNASSNSTL